MRWLEPPDEETWRARAEWFWQAHDANAGPFSLELPPRRAQLLGELEAAFCAGAWIAVVALAWALVEDEHWTGDPREAPDLDWLREQRNALVHPAEEDEDDEAPTEPELEETAQAALRIVFKTLFAAAWR